MVRRAVLCVLAGVMSASSLAFATSFALSPDEAKRVYDVDKQKVLSGDLNFDWREFRLGAVEGGAEPFDWRPVRADFMQKMESGDNSGALVLADNIIGHNMAEPEGHMLAMMALRALGRQEDADFQRKVVAAWIKSLRDSGDGKSADHAIFVVATGEEYFYVGVALGAGSPVSQALVSKKGHSFDILKVKTRDGGEQEVWFNVDTSIASIRQALSDAK